MVNKNIKLGSQIDERNNLGLVIWSRDVTSAVHCPFRPKIVAVL